MYIYICLYTYVYAMRADSIASSGHPPRLSASVFSHSRRAYASMRHSCFHHPLPHRATSSACLPVALCINVSFMSTPPETTSQRDTEALGFKNKCFVEV